MLHKLMLKLSQHYCIRVHLRSFCSVL